MDMMKGNISEMHRSSVNLTDLEGTLNKLRTGLQPDIDAAAAQWYSAGSLAEFQRLVTEYDDDLAQIKGEMLRQAAAHEISNLEYGAAEERSVDSLRTAAGSSSGGMHAALNPAG